MAGWSLKLLARLPKDWQQGLLQEVDAAGTVEEAAAGLGATPAAGATNVQGLQRQLLQGCVHRQQHWLLHGLMPQGLQG